MEDLMHCKNCEQEMPQNGKFCPNCGQKTFDGRIRIKELLSNMMINVIHLDGKFIKMFWTLFIPGKVSTEYFQGKIIRYPHPFQFFFIVMFFFVLVSSKQCNHLINQEIKLDGAEIQNDSTERYTPTTFFKAAEKYVEYKKIRQAYDLLPDTLQSPLVASALDSIISYRKNSIRGLFKTDSITLSLPKKRIGISVQDLVYTQPEAISQKYGITHWRDRILLQQGVKSIRDVRSLNNALMGSITWTVLSFIVVMAAVFWLFLRKKRNYYVEHFIFLMHCFSAILMVLTLGIALDFWVFALPEALEGVVFLLMAVFMFFSMRKFYGLSNRATFAYWLLLGIISAIMLMGLAIVGPLISLLIF